MVTFQIESVYTMVQNMCGEWWNKKSDYVGRLGTGKMCCAGEACGKLSCNSMQLYGI
jgi:hypothetical protein